MSDPRILGLTLMAISVAAFTGTTSGSLPSAVFFPALGLFVIGAFKFLRTNHEAMAKAERRAEQAVSPLMRENRHAQALAERQAQRQGAGLLSLNANDQRKPATADYGRNSEAVEIELEETDLVVTTDVSFPLEIQTGDALADQLHKLKLLLEQSVLTEEEYAVAKAKLLS